MAALVVSTVVIACSSSKTYLLIFTEISKRYLQEKVGRSHPSTPLITSLNFLKALMLLWLHAKDQKNSMHWFTIKSKNSFWVAFCSKTPVKNLPKKLRIFLPKMLFKSILSLYSKTEEIQKNIECQSFIKLEKPHFGPILVPLARKPKNRILPIKKWFISMSRLVDSCKKSEKFLVQVHFESFWRFVAPEQEFFRKSESVIF